MIGLRAQRDIAAAALVAMLLLAGAEVRADDPPSTGTAPAGNARDLQLRGLQDSLSASEARRQALSSEIAQLKNDRARFQTSLIETTKKVSDQETKIADAESRLEKLSTRQDATKRSLEGRRAVIAEILAALQRMGRKPPPALLVDPDDVLKAIRTSMLLGAVIPGMRAETETLVADLTDLSQTRAAIETEKQKLDRELAELTAERMRLTVLIDARQTATGKAESDLEAERVKAQDLARQAGSFKDLIGQMEGGTDAVRKATEAAHESDAKLASLTPNAAVKDPARLAPSVPFGSLKGLLSLPVSGSVLRRFGEDDGLGSTEKGLLLSTRRSAVVAAPADGWIVYAGAYRSFGQLLILNTGGGYYIVLAGMDRINVDLGQFVSAGEPVAVMGDGSTKTAAAIALGAAQPVLYVEFRKDGASIDPGPWWAGPQFQRVRG